MSVTKLNFEITPAEVGNYYGFTLDRDMRYLTPQKILFHNSGKSVLEQNIIGHVSRFPDNFQLVGVDCKRVNNFAHAY